MVGGECKRRKAKFGTSQKKPDFRSGLIPSRGWLPG